VLIWELVGSGSAVGDVRQHTWQKFTAQLKPSSLATARAVHRGALFTGRIGWARAAHSE
jgi:hypothetical protein